MLSNKGTCVAACISPKTARLFQASLLHRSTPRPGLSQKPREQCFPLPRKAAKPGLRAGPGPPQRPAFSSLLCRLVLLRGKWEQEPAAPHSADFGSGPVHICGPRGSAWAPWCSPAAGVFSRAACLWRHGTPQGTWEDGAGVLALRGSAQPAPGQTWQQDTCGLKHS